MQLIENSHWIEFVSFADNTSHVQLDCYRRRDKLVCKQPQNVSSQQRRKHRIISSFQQTRNIYSQCAYSHGSGSGKPPFSSSFHSEESPLDPEDHSLLLVGGLSLNDWLNKLVKRESVNSAKPSEGLMNKDDEQNRKVRKIVIEDSRVLNRDVVRRTVEPLYGKKLDPVLVKDVITTLNVWYEENGYKFSRINKSGPFRNGVLSFRAIEPRFAGIRLVYLDDNREPCNKGRTKSDTIEKAVGIQRGQVFRWSDRYWERITELGLFDYVRAELELRDDQSVMVILRVRERPYSRFEPGIGYGSGEFFGELSFQDNNLFGRNQFLQFELQKRQSQHSLLSLEWEDPRVGQWFGYRFKVYRDLDEKHLSSRSGLTFKVFSRLVKHLFVDLSSTLERTMPLGAEDSTRPSYDINKYLLGMISLGITYDDRYPPKNVQSGQRLVIHLSDAIPWNESFSSFIKGDIQIAKYLKLPLGSTLVYGVSGKSASESLPELEKHRLGGMGSLRGYSTGALGTAVSSLQQTWELRFPIVDRISGVFFYDCLDETGSFWKHPKRLGWSKGVGLRIAEMIRLDYAWKQDGSGMMHVEMINSFFILYDHTMDDDAIQVERELAIRKRLGKIFKRKREDFNTEEEFNDYLEAFEDVVYQLSEGTNSDETQESMEKLKKYIKDTGRQDILENVQILDTENNEQLPSFIFLDPARPAKPMPSFRI
ncbi:outer membrane protein [Galdieria sulphuraria]|uniref:Outer membrane protein (Plastid) n=1 Tax=Galdieria sulphuraria TaxID=130081 RepID=M2XSV1_GALSU|nr:outer membrane protein [Galdieria sulphuraria]EME26743.1 outer membrane protein [Galdieria sulphuraria]|eukprot:XP_005703263.1 outer membrane protein [Galdieria sulphuraria]